MIRTWSNRELRKLKKEYPSCADVRELAKSLNKTYGAVKSKATILNLKRTYQHWTKQMDAIMIKSYPVKTIPELLPILKQFNPKLTESSIAGRAFKLSLHKTAEFKTEKGRYGRSLQGPNPNKGNKNFRIANSEHTRFKKGSTPLNTLYDGAIVTRIYHRNKREYKWIRLNGKWHMLHVVRYEETYGPVPDGKIVVFKDGNPLNVHISNLECISLAENMLRNTIHRFPPELKEIIHLTTRVKRKIKKLTKNG